MLSTPAREFPVVEPVPRVSSKAVAALVLAVSGLLLSPALGGVVPAWFALRLAAAASEEIGGSEGFLTGLRLLRWAPRLAWAAFFIAAGVATVLAVYLVIRYGVADQSVPQYDDDVS